MWPFALAATFTARVRSPSIPPPGSLSTATSPFRRARSSPISVGCSRRLGRRYLADMDDFAAMNAVYGTFFSSPAPARSTIQAARLPRDARVEIDVIAVIG